MRAADIMTRQVVTAAPGTSVSTVAQLLLEHRIGALPVVDDEGHVVGIASDHDLLRHPPADSPRAWWLRLFNEDAICLEDIATARDLEVGDIMVRPVVTVSDTTPLGVLATLMRRRKLRHVPVLHDGKLVGIVSRGDLLDALVRPPEPATGSAAAV
jgi:CBS domain-containing protein